MRQLKISKQITQRDTGTLDKYLSDIAKERLLTADEEVELGDPAVSGTSGSFTIQAGENEEVFLLWYDTSLPEEETVFARAAE